MSVRAYAASVYHYYELKFVRKRDVLACAHSCETLDTTTPIVIIMLYLARPRLTLLI